MPFDRFLIAPINTGLQQDLRPWLIPDDAFQLLQNAYIFRGRIRKRFGSLFMDYNYLHSRLRVNIGTTNGAGALAGNVRAIIGDATLPLNVGQAFSVGNALYTVISSVPGAQPMLATQGAGTFDISNSNFSITGAPAATAVFFYPGFPVMGITQYISQDLAGIDNHPTYAYDTRYAYKFTPGTGWDRSGTGVNPIFHGNTFNYFWSTNWEGVTSNVIALFTTNFNATVPAPAATDDPIWVTQDGATWTNFSAVTIFNTGGSFVATSLIILPFKNRLILLNTIEQTGGVNAQFKNRCRYSHNGSPFATNAWLEPNQTFGGTFADGAGFVDAATDEAIVSAEFIKDRLIVYFERSTWELAYTANETLPFVWQKLNTELGSQSTFSTVPFDKAVLTIGETGVHACNGSNVERIDIKIPDVIFSFAVDSDFNARTYGIRDYETELVYWAFTSYREQTTQNFNDSTLIYNYRNNSWAANDDTIMCFGYLEQSPTITWAQTQLSWQQAYFPWVMGQQNQRLVLYGNQEGFVLMIEPDVSRNAPSLQITNITIPSVVSGLGYADLEVINHNLQADDFVSVENILDPNNSITPVSGIYVVDAIIDANNFTILAIDNNNVPMAGTYHGGYVSARVSNIQIRSKQWNPYVSEDRNVFLHKIDFAVARTASGEITVDYLPSASQQSMIEGGFQTGAIMGTGVLETHPYNPALYPLEQFQDRLWHPIYFQTTGTCVQIFMFFQENQITNPNIAWEDFEIEGMCLYTSPSSMRLQ